MERRSCRPCPCFALSTVKSAARWSTVDEFCSAREVAPEATYTVNLTIDGLLSNTIGHGYDDEAHRIMVNVRLEVAALVVAFVDDGAAFDPTRMPEQDIETLLGNRDPGEFLLTARQLASTTSTRRRDF